MRTATFNKRQQGDGKRVRYALQIPGNKPTKYTHALICVKAVSAPFVLNILRESSSSLAVIFLSMAFTLTNTKKKEKAN